MAGHAQTSQAEAQEALTDVINENDVRNRALRELHVARALWRCGDTPAQLGEKTLAAYSRDLRGPLARHALAVLNERGA